MFFIRFGFHSERKKKKRNFNFLETQNVFILIKRNVTHNTNNTEALSSKLPPKKSSGH